MLESTLHEPINNDRYSERLARARENVRDKVSDGDAGIVR
jgi:hypothetical protein